MSARVLSVVSISGWNVFACALSLQIANCTHVFIELFIEWSGGGGAVECYGSFVGRTARIERKLCIRSTCWRASYLIWFTATGFNDSSRYGSSLWSTTECESNFPISDIGYDSIQCFGTSNQQTNMSCQLQTTQSSYDGIFNNKRLIIVSSFFCVLSDGGNQCRMWYNQFGFCELIWRVRIICVGGKKTEIIHHNSKNWTGIFRIIKFRWILILE